MENIARSRITDQICMCRALLSSIVTFRLDESSVEGEKCVFRSTRSSSCVSRKQDF